MVDILKNRRGPVGEVHFDMEHCISNAGAVTQELAKEKQINWEIVECNIWEARGELSMLLKLMEDPNNRTEGRLDVSLRHAYFHLNFAWNVRHVTSEKYAALTDSDFRRWGKFSKGFDRY